MINDDRDQSVSTAFEQLRRSVEPTVDVDAAFAHFERQRSSRIGWHRGGRVAIISAAATILVVGGVMLRPWDDTTAVVSDGSTVATTTEVTRPACPRPGQLFIYMAPDASTLEVYDVSAFLGNLVGVRSPKYHDKEATYDEFRRLFADQPDLAVSLDAADLPVSFRPVRDVPWDETTIETLASLAGVMRVATAEEQRAPNCFDNGGSEVSGDQAVAGTDGESPHGDVPGKGVVDQPMGPMRSVAPFQVPGDQWEAAGFGGYSAPVGAADPELTGYIDRDDMFPTSTPANDTFPQPMAPIWNENRTQIGWWAVSLGWVTFEEVADENFDFREKWSNARAETEAFARRQGMTPPDEPAE